MEKRVGMGGTEGWKGRESFRLLEICVSCKLKKRSIWRMRYKRAETI